MTPASSRSGESQKNGFRNPRSTHEVRKMTLATSRSGELRKMASEIHVQRRKFEKELLSVNYSTSSALSVKSRPISCAPVGGVPVKGAPMPKLVIVRSDFNESLVFNRVVDLVRVDQDDRLEGWSIRDVNLGGRPLGFTDRSPWTLGLYGRPGWATLEDRSVYLWSVKGQR
ncbi:hypothetical protein LR48_Vigan03g184900 [Vigna angularis]|uniref:Uncharacterized protein n=1 Tax=Phaseolus angularis TaxID=3914 RepID=A0A0L9U728_PHAAN|nr:hypothetical protein LR48_Vigan03g184900 [Vigna angularis]